MVLGRKAKRRRNQVGARGNSYVESAEAEESMEDDKDDDEPIATLGSKWKKHKTSRKKISPIEDKENETTDKENQPAVEDIAKAMEPTSDDGSENGSLVVESKTMGANSEEPANASTESYAPHPLTNPYFNRPAVSNYKKERSRAAPSVPFSRHAFFLARNDIT
jgi:hypothetical protein